ncbi:hypothetical protein LCGC14_1468020 [marine sediment metagenome]|uniref:YcxB-like protein domain-containing protein n=1 Tax=marine sediment metagenome TaxID=412755 RepID=A0A0F9JZ46_9ZZZZ
MTCLYFILIALAAFLVLLCVAAIGQRLGLMTRAPVEQIGRFIGLALRGGDIGTRLVLRHVGSKRQIRFLNTMAPGRERGLRMVLKEKYCCESEFAGAQRLLSQGGYQFQTHAVGAQKELAIDFGQDVEQACKAAELVILRVFGLDEHAQFRAGWRGPLDLRKAQCDVVGPGARGRVGVEHGGTCTDLYGPDDDAGDDASPPAPPAEDAAFTFETDVEIDEDAYVYILRTGPTQHSPQRYDWLRRLPRSARTGILCVICVLAGVCFLSKYTWFLGVLLLALPTLAVIGRSRMCGLMRGMYRRKTYLHDRATHGASQDLLWIRGNTFELQAEWNRIYGWHVRAGWMILAVTNKYGLSFEVFLPVAELKERGLYDRVLLLAQTHAHKVP